MNITVRAWLWMVVLVAMCSACSQVTSAPTSTMVPTVAINTAVAAMNTSTTTPVTEATATPTGPATGYPAPTTENSLLPQDEEGVTAFHDCVVMPGLVGCDPQAPAIAARLAVQDPQMHRVLVLDLSSGEGWQINGEASSLAWLTNRIWLQLTGPSSDQSWLFDFLTKSLSEPTGVFPVYDEDSTAAWIEESGGDVVLRVQQIGADAADTVFLHPHSPDTIYQPDRLFLLRSWVPGEYRVLAQVYTGGGDAMITGGELTLIDATTGEFTGLDVDAPITDAAEFVWNPQRPDELAFLASREAGAPPRLSFINLSSRHITYPKEEGLRVDGLAWHPDGARLTFAAHWDQPADANRYKAPAIYALDLGSGAVEQLTQPPQNAEDGRPGWSADGEVLLYGRWIQSAPGRALMQVRARRIADGQEWLLVELPAGEADRVIGRIFWQSYLTVTPW